MPGKDENVLVLYTNAAHKRKAYSSVPNRRVCTFINFEKKFLPARPFIGLHHGLGTPNEGINQRYLKNWADVADEICFGRT